MIETSRFPECRLYMRLSRILHHAAVVMFTLGFTVAGIDTGWAQKANSGNAKADPAQRLEKLQELGKDTSKLQLKLEAGGGKADPTQKLERLQEQGKDPSKILNRALQAGIDSNQLLDWARQAGIDTSQLEDQSTTPVPPRLPPDAPGRAKPVQTFDRAVDAYQASLEFSDEEWIVVRPLISEVLEKRNLLNGVPVETGPEKPKADRTNRSSPSPSPEESALRAALESSATTTDLKAKLDQFRSVKQRQEEELKVASETLRRVLSVRREAEAVLIGLLR